MDLIHHPEYKTVVAFIGNVSMYENGDQTFNFHVKGDRFKVKKCIHEGTIILCVMRLMTSVYNLNFGSH